MGTEVVQVGVGQPPVVFSVHKNLLCMMGKKLQDMANLKLPKGQVVVLANEDPNVFKLFLNYLYQQRVPQVLPNTSALVQAARLRDLCQLYAFADKNDIIHTFRNKVMDAIQDGFVLMNAFPKPPLILQVYERTLITSMLRKFCAASLVFTLRSPTYVDDGSLPSLLNEKDEIMDDFLLAVRGFDFKFDGRDPRIRDCQGEPTCVECVSREGGMQGKTGFWPCYFHLHKVENFNGSKTEGSTQAGDMDRALEKADLGCYLWNC